MKPRGRRRRGLVLLRAVRILKRHHFSMLTATLLAVASVIVLTDNRFEPPRRSEAPESDGLTLVPGSNLHAPGEQWLIYYVADSPDEMRGPRSPMHSDAFYLQAQAFPPPPHTSVGFLLLETPQARARGARFLTQVAEMAPLDGFNLQVVDLTR